jgi:hypothetical protein
MVVHTCERCLCTFNKKSSYNDHVKRKIPCKLVKQNEEHGEIQLMLTEMNKMKQKINKIEQMEEQMKEMKKTIDSQKKIINGNNYNYDKCNITNNIIAFGKEDTSFISDAMYKKILNRGYAAPKALTEHIHFNKDKPEYQNVYMSSKKNKKYVTVNDGEKWIERFKIDVVEELKIVASEMIKSKVNILDPKNEIDNKIKTKISRFIESYDNEDNDKLNRYDEDIDLMLYNNREMVKNTHVKK